MTYWKFLEECSKEAKERQVVYKEDAWKDYTEEDLVGAIRFFAKRITHRKDIELKLAELRRIINYAAQLATNLKCCE